MGDVVLIDLRKGLPEIKPKENSHCFFIVEHSDDKCFMREVAQRLLTGKCKDHHFYGRYAGEWEMAFDETDITLHDNEEDWSVTSLWQTQKDFQVVLSLQVETSERVYLFFDADIRGALK